jgi:hypothetical protein
MAKENKRRSPREEIKAPLALVLATGSLKGETVDLSREGVLIKAKGQVTMVLNLHGREYRGRLVRATPLENDETAYAIELDDPFEGVEASEPS